MEPLNTLTSILNLFPPSTYGLYISFLTLKYNGSTSWEKQKSILNQTRGSKVKVDIPFFQETFSTSKVENHWLEK